MKIVKINCIWIDSGFGIYLKFAHLVDKYLYVSISLSRCINMISLFLCDDALQK